MRRAWAALLVAGLLAAGCTGDDPAPAPGPAPATVALPGCPGPGPASTSAGALPDLDLPCLDGGPGLALRRLTGTPTVVNLWASWCGPCKDELPAFARLDQDAGTRVRVLGVASRDVSEESARLAGALALPFPSLEDRSGDLGRLLRRNGLPVTVFVRADGSVAEAYLGRPLTDATLRAKVRTLLGVDV